MDKHLKAYKTEFERKIPTTFTNEDKRIIMEKINQIEGKQHKRPFPKFIPITVITTLLFIGIMIFQQKMDTDLTDEMTSFSGEEESEMEMAEEKEITTYSEDSYKLTSIFDPNNVFVGDTVGKMRVTHVENKDEAIVIIFTGNNKITGEIIRTQGKLKFTPKEQSWENIPIAADDQEKAIPIYFDNEKISQRLNNSNGKVINEQTIEVKEIHYHYSAQGSKIHLQITGE